LPKPMVGDRLGRFLSEHEITHLAVTPSVLASIGTRPLPALQCIVCAGEACPQELIDAWAPDRLFFNAYGPTEATIYATVSLCRRGAPVSIGKALNHIDTYILDDDLKSVPRGEIGELCLGGAGVAEKYLASEEESKRRFLILHRDGQLRQRIYRTGDLVRQEADGNLSFLGRSDNQIKIRGNRVELEEIEHSVQRVPGVSEVAVGIDKSAGAQELICFVVMAPGHTFDASVIAERLSVWLPSYMVPSHFVRLDAMPLTASGKKDRRSLVPKYRKLFTRRTLYVEPRNKIEAKLAIIWRKVLEIDNVSVYDSFASLGGDSLKSLVLIEEVERQFQVSVPPGYFGHISTIYRMAVQLADLAGLDANSRASAGRRLYRKLRNLKRHGWAGVQFKSGSLASTSSFDGFRSTRLYKQLRDLTNDWPGERYNAESLISSLGKRDASVDLFVCVQHQTEYLALSQHLGSAVRVHSMRSGHLVMDYIDANIERLASYYIEEIDQIKPQGKFVFAGICQGCTIAHAIAKKLQQRGEHVPLLVCIEAARPLPFDGNVAFFYSHESPLNPQRKGGFAKYDEILGGRYSVDFLPGEFGAAWDELYVQILTAKLQNRLEPFRGRLGS
jgi:acyl carrier protein